MTHTLVKICGLRDLATARAALAAGADYLGFVFAPSPRRVLPEEVRAIARALPDWARLVGVFVDERTEVINQTVAWCGLDYAQLSGDEPHTRVSDIRAPVLKAIRLGQAGRSLETELEEYRAAAMAPATPFAGGTAAAGAGVAAFVLDTFQSGAFGGTGKTCDWQLAAGLAARYPSFLGGGLHQENVGPAIAAVRPLGVDVSSGVEVVGRPGVKDIGRIEAFIAAVRRTER